MQPLFQSLYLPLSDRGRLLVVVFGFLLFLFEDISVKNILLLSF